MTTSKPDVQALIEEADEYLKSWGGDYVQRGEDMVRRLREALSALSGETETVWEYGIQYGDTWSFEAFPSQWRAQLVLSATFRDKLVRRTANRVIPAGEWEVVV